MTREDLEICFELKLKILLAMDNPRHNPKYSICRPSMYRKVLYELDSHMILYRDYLAPFTKVINCKISKALYPQALEYKNYLLIPKYEKEFAKWKD